ncbi:MAG: hypothetical protein JWN02_385 [Acidobacteria bacterium]|nr:hypothetical protein [Acidobacteriota bacterium]
MLTRYLQLALIHRAVRSDLTWKQFATTPLLDALLLYAWLVPFFSNRITWRGYEARIGRGTELLQPVVG